MILPGMVVVFMMILAVLYLTRYPIPRMLSWVIYAIITVLLSIIVLQIFGLLGPFPAMRLTH
jgi:hypothetical protein